MDEFFSFMHDSDTIFLSIVHICGFVSALNPAFVLGSSGDISHQSLTDELSCRLWHYAFTVYAHAGTHTYADMKASAYKYNQGTLGFFVGSFLQLLNTRFSLRISLHGDNFLCTDNQKQSNETTLLHSNLVKTKTLIHRGWCEQMLVKTRNLQ